MVRCENCGFLALRDYETHELVEADVKCRESTIFARNMGVPLCFVREHEIGKEVLDMRDAQQIDAQEAAPKVMRMERQCSAFTPWYQGFTPKEHREMLLDLERKKLELQERQAERQWTEQREQGSRRFQLFNTLVSAFAGAVFAAVVGGVFAWLAIRPAAPQGPARPDKTPPIMPSADR